MKEIKVKDFIFPDYKTIRDGFLVTAGTLDDFNTMTAGWGNFGVFWSKPSLIVFVKSCRYTYKFMNNNDYFTASFLKKGYKNAIKTCGTLHGNEVDKIQLSGLSPIAIGPSVSFTQAKTIVLCKKVYFSDINSENIRDPEVSSKFYEAKEYHRIYFGEIVKILEQ